MARELTLKKIDDAAIMWEKTKDPKQACSFIKQLRVRAYQVVAKQYLSELFIS